MQQFLLYLHKHDIGSRPILSSKLLATYLCIPLVGNGSLPCALAGSHMDLQDRTELDDPASSKTPSAEACCVDSELVPSLAQERVLQLAS